MNDSGDLFSPETKVKRFLDSLAYFFMLGNMRGIETDYKRVMHAKREIPMSSCPSFIENMLFASGSATNQIDREECESFRVMTERLDENAKKYESPKPKKKWPESKFHKCKRLGISGGEWCRVDVDGKFVFNGHIYRIDPSSPQYQPIETDEGFLYDMDRVLAGTNYTGEFFDMNYDKVLVEQMC